MSAVEWKEPPPSHEEVRAAFRATVIDLAAPLKERPGHWASIGQYDKGDARSALRCLRIAGFEVVNRDGEVYARWPEAS